METVIQIIVILALVSVSVVLISQNRHPVSTLAWILILCFLPGVGLVLYYVFGTQKKKSRLVKDSRLSELKDQVVYSNEDSIRRELPDGHSDIVSLLWMTNKAIPLGDNDIKVYTRFDDMFDDLIRDISAAKDHVNIEFYIFEDDEIGRRLGNVLIELVKKGVEVRVIYDSAANLTRAKFYHWLRKNGVKVKAFLPVVLPYLSTTTNNRNHRKIVVIDGKIGYIGGMNIAERYSKGIRGGVWRDTHIRITGPSAAETQTAFLVDWEFCAKEHVDCARYYPRIGKCGDSIVQIATSGPMDEWNVTMQGMMRMINQAKEYVYIESPYLIPTEPVLMALRNAALAGVDVRLIVPVQGDRGVLVPLATRSYVEDVLVAGVKVYFYKKGYLHAKTMVADGTMATVGSTNLDVRSFEQNFEINAFIYDREVAETLKEAFLKDIGDSVQVDAKKWASRSKWNKFKESIARLFSPVL
ncbi:MAG: cardiolipin synthase [Candidatus Cryptobacteroides sp.]